MAKTPHRLQYWFDQGANALRSTSPERPPYYLCPICCREFEQPDLDKGLLTTEHAPPRWFGGKRVALTCRECNNTAGSTIDSEMKHLHDMWRFDKGEMSEHPPLRARVEYEGQSANAEIRSLTDGLEIQHPKKINHPDRLASFLDELDEARADEARAEDEIVMRFPQSTHNPWRAGIGWLRAAYIVSFAALGYQYALHSDLDIVRHQINNPHDHSFENFVGFDNSSDDTVRKMYLVTTPRSIMSLLIQMGRYCVILPPPGLGQDFYDQKRIEYVQQAFTRSIPAGHFFSIPWPKQPTHALDHSELSNPWGEIG